MRRLPDPHEFLVEVKNNGYSILTNIRPVITGVPDKFKVEYMPEVISICKPQEKARFMLKITSDADLNAGDYYVDLRVKSDQYSLTPVSIRVFVKQKVEALIIGVLIAAILLNLLFLIKYGRR
ncbi:MAG: COG1470 family protein [Thermoproteota archaeon]